MGVVDFLRRCRERDTMEDTDIRMTRATGADIPGWTDTPPSGVSVTTTTGVATAPVAQGPAPVVTGDDPVDAPAHYRRGGFELGEVLYVWGLTHRRASAVEYIMRAGDKDPAREVEDLRKAIRNLEMELEYMERYGRRTA